MAGNKQKSKKSRKAAALPTSVEIDGEEVSIEETLDRAEVALVASRKQMLTLHKSWRVQLRRIGVMVLMILLQKCSEPVSECRRDITEHNNPAAASEAEGGADANGFEDDASSSPLAAASLIGNWETVQYCVGHSMTEIFSALCCLGLVWLMYLPEGGRDFNSLPFRVSLSMVPMVLASYYGGTPVVGSCLGGSFESADESSGEPREFPVVLIFFAVGVVSLYFMNQQLWGQEKGMQKIETMRKLLVKNKKQK